MMKKHEWQRYHIKVDSVLGLGLDQRTFYTNLIYFIQQKYGVLWVSLERYDYGGHNRLVCFSLNVSQNVVWDGRRWPFFFVFVLGSTSFVKVELWCVVIQRVLFNGNYSIFSGKSTWRFFFFVNHLPMFFFLISPALPY